MFQNLLLMYDFRRILINVDVKNDHKHNGFDLSIADKLKKISIPLIYFGGCE